MVIEYFKYQVPECTVLDALTYDPPNLKRATNQMYSECQAHSIRVQNKKHPARCFLFREEISLQIHSFIL
jgi:hypothetical protein